MNILPAANADVPQLLELWMEAFGEEKEAVLPFFREIFPLCRPFCAKDGQTVCAMAYALPQTVRAEGKTIPAAYLYAVATKREYRGKGLASRLLTHMADQLQKEGIHGLLLVPANLPLFDFYEKLGFAPFSFRQMVTVSAADLAVKGVAAEDYLALREAFLPRSHNVPPAPVLEHLDLFAWDGGCAAAERTEGGLILREVLGALTGASGVVKALGAETAKAHLADGDTPYAVAKPLAEDFPETGYFAFAME